jgi:hypothetical protein
MVFWLKIDLMNKLSMQISHFRREIMIHSKRPKESLFLRKNKEKKLIFWIRRAIKFYQNKIKKSKESKNNLQWSFNMIDQFQE